MTTAQKIKMALAYKGITQSDLARRLGSSPQAFSQRMKTDKFSVSDLEQIAAILGANYSFSFEFEDGTII